MPGTCQLSPAADKCTTEILLSISFSPGVTQKFLETEGLGECRLREAARSRKVFQARYFLLSRCEGEKKASKKTFGETKPCCRLLAGRKGGLFVLFGWRYLRLKCTCKWLYVFADRAREDQICLFQPKKTQQGKTKLPSCVCFGCAGVGSKEPAVGTRLPGKCQAVSVHQSSATFVGPAWVDGEQTKCPL